MKNPIRAGMYRGKNEIRPVSLDRRLVKVKTDDDIYIDVPSLEYVRNLEQQILELKKTVGIITETNQRHEGAIKRMMSYIRKVGSTRGE